MHRLGTLVRAVAPAAWAPLELLLSFAAAAAEAASSSCGEELPLPEELGRTLGWPWANGYSHMYKNGPWLSSSYHVISFEDDHGP